MSDERIERVIGRVLQGGVMLAATIVVVAAVAYLRDRHGLAAAGSVFHGEPADLRTIGGIIHGAREWSPRAWIQLGVVILLATPVARVVLLLGAFALQRDRLYVVISLLVLLALGVGLAGGGG